VLDTGTGRGLQRVLVGVGAHDVAVGDLAWVTHGARDVPLTLLSLYPGPRRLAPNGTLAAGGPAHDIDHALDTADVFVTFWEYGVVARLRTGGRNGRVRSLPVGRGPHNVAVVQVP